VSTILAIFPSAPEGLSVKNKKNGLSIVKIYRLSHLQKYTTVDNGR